ncbi:outer membrane protein [Xanthobacter tagetidis]|nr:outer membrane beta-barrel protein [Xanthobacter tagetidis]MBB6307321.1 opacity protein-like surface antigen [Xanthobacter tagetidis]
MIRGAFLASACAFACLLAPANAHAADMAPAAPPPTAPGSWTGFYLGAYAGSAVVDTWWGKGDGVLTPRSDQILPVLGSATAAVVGGQIGYNQQVGQMVLGIEADLGTGSLHGTARCGFDWTSACTSDTDLIGTLAARAGIAFGSVLLYGKAGLALAHTAFSASGKSYQGEISASQTATGWTAGGGVELALTPSVSVKAEYAFLDFGSTTPTLADATGRSNLDITQSAQLVKLGVNVRPGGAPLPGTRAQPGGAGQGATHDWSGLYVGAHAGGAWGRDEWTDATGFLAATVKTGTIPGGGDSMGMFGGVQGGFNLQAGAWVAGIDASASAATIGAYAKCLSDNVTFASFACRTTAKSLGTVAGRLGYGFGDALVYGKAGAAWVSGTVDLHNAYKGPLYATDATRWGWLLGAGVEYALTDRVSAFVEYDHMDFGTSDIAITDGRRSATVSLDQSLDLVRMGVNYRFGPASPTAGPAAPAAPAGWSLEAGARYFLSTGHGSLDLFSPMDRNQLNSRLSYGDTTGQAPETFFRLDHESGVFLKGYGGIGTLSGGKFIDEDFPPGEIPYSSTRSLLKAGSLAYGGIDLGYDFIRGPSGTLGAYVGYRGSYDKVLAYGCWQVAGNPDVCADTKSGKRPVQLVLGETGSWQALALGLNGRLALAPRIALELDAAYLPYALRAGYDNHWWRGDINPQPETGSGWGTMAQAVLTYAVSDRFDLGIGARYEFLATTTASTQFPADVPRSPETVYSERYGAFVQASYRFGDIAPESAPQAAAPVKAATAPAADWTGLYAGAALGAGKGHTTYASPFATPVNGDAVDLGGALIGGQIGADAQIGALVVGAELSGAWTRMVGTNTCFASAPAPAGFNCGTGVEALSALTARLGYAFGRSLIYARGGAAWARQNDAFNTHPPHPQRLSAVGTNTGWTAGAGIEYALLPDLSVGLEYRHYAFGASDAVEAPATPTLAGVSVAPDTLRLDTVALTLNYRFGTGGGR